MKSDIYCDLVKNTQVSSNMIDGVDLIGELKIKTRSRSVGEEALDESRTPVSECLSSSGILGQS